MTKPLFFIKCPLWECQSRAEQVRTMHLHCLPKVRLQRRSLDIPAAGTWGSPQKVTPQGTQRCFIKLGISLREKNKNKQTKKKQTPKPQENIMRKTISDREVGQILFKTTNQRQSALVFLEIRRNTGSFCEKTR